MYAAEMNNPLVSQNQSISHESQGRSLLHMATQGLRLIEDNFMAA